MGERTAGILTAAEEAAANLRDEAKHYAREDSRADADDESRKARLNASQRMDEMIADAEAKSQRIIDDAVARRRQLNQAISSLIERRDEIAADATRLAEELMEAVEALRSPGMRDDAGRIREGCRGTSFRGAGVRDRDRARAQVEEIEVPEPEPTSDEIAMDEPESEQPDSEETALFDVESEADDEGTIEEDSEETEIYEPDTSDLPQGPSKLLVDPDAEDETPPHGSPR